MSLRVDLNSDLGETVDGVPTADDEAMFELVTSANIACGFHAGDRASMRASVDLAIRNGVRIGAHVSYDDPGSFGRANVEIAHGALMRDVAAQLEALDRVAAEHRTTGDSARGSRASIEYVKPHGALYNRIVHDEVQADAVGAAIAAYRAGCPVLGLPGSAIERAARSYGLPFVPEGFADRAYQPDGTLAPRSHPGAVLHDPDAVAERAVRMVADGVVTATDGTRLLMPIDSICIHGDTPGSVAIARAVRASLESAAVAIAPFVAT